MIRRTQTLKNHQIQNSSIGLNLIKSFTLIEEENLENSDPNEDDVITKD